MGRDTDGSDNGYGDETWEHCCLQLRGAEKARGGFRYDLSVVYYGERVAFVQLARRSGAFAALARRSSGSRVFTHNPFDAALAQLGQLGWQLVTVQRGDSSAATMLTEIQGRGGLRDYQIVAYFKRPARPGRELDQPPVVLPEARDEG